MTSKKICSICQANPSRNQSRGGYCNDCGRAYGKQNYNDNKERYFKQAKNRDIQIDELINKYKSKPCTDCGISYPPYVMDFDHLDGDTKEFGICHMRRRRMAFKKIIAEIEKCEVVCANCHRERTNKRNPARYTKGQKSPGAT